MILFRHSLCCLLRHFQCPSSNRELRRKGFTGKIFGVTGNVNQTDVDYFVASGANAVVGKPLSKKKVEQMLTGEWVSGCMSG